MIKLPIIHELSVDGYALYPGTTARPGLNIDFRPGLTLILGANGLGKTTLITILFRMLAGPYDIPNLASGVDFGNRRLEVRQLSRADRRIFAERVIDDAAKATATLKFALGETVIEITRSLADLELLRLRVEQVPSMAAQEESYQSIVQENANLSLFADWILILRYLIFYFEDRRALVWDASAQRQLLRLLFLDREASTAQSAMEREILSLDSSVRNQQYALGREEKRVARTEASLGTSDEVRQQLALFQRIQDDELTRLAELDDSLVSLDAKRKEARVNALNAEQAQESAMRSLERYQLTAIRAAFPNASQTAEYLLGQILADETCLVCQNEVPNFAEDLRARILSHRCVVCGSNIPADKGSSQRTAREITRATKDFEQAETQATAAAAERDAAETSYDELVTKIAELASSTATRSADIDNLIRRLPPDEQALHEQRSYLATMRGRLAADRQLLQQLRNGFGQFADRLNIEISSRGEEIKDAFESYASGFLIEGCELVWAPRKSRLGETGELIDFPAFELSMTGAGFRSPVRRTGPQQVSESQREFIDLAFRMSLMQVAAAGGTSMVIDAPESSLDAVFVTRAATVLTRFGSPRSDNRLLVTSNLIDGDLIPQLLRKANIKTPRSRRIVDLLKLATPTAATAELHDLYERVRERIFERAREAS
jgi:hypothetical protein